MNIICNRCKIEKDELEFSPYNRTAKRRICKLCSKEYHKKHYLENKEKILAGTRKYREINENYTKEYYEKNKEVILSKNREHYNQNKEKTLISVKKYASSNKEKRNIYTSNRRKKDVIYKLSNNLRNRIRNAIYRNSKSGSAVKDLGCSIEELKLHLESKFQDGMTWENWTNDGWHIDHIKPLASFDLTDMQQFLEAVHYTNLQPLWCKENLKKGDK